MQTWTGYSLKVEHLTSILKAWGSRDKTQFLPLLSNDDISKHHQSDFKERKKAKIYSRITTTAIMNFLGFVKF